jgi:mutator protein MutT
MRNCSVCGFPLKPSEEPHGKCDDVPQCDRNRRQQLPTKPTNPKDAIGSDKLPVDLWPPSATAVGCLGLLDGALKYGRSNWRATPVLASVYIGALKRHTDAYYEGYTMDPDSGIPHLSGILANGAILVDAGAAGTLVDDRQYPGGYAKLVDELTPHVARLKMKHKDKNPKHYTIADAIEKKPVTLVSRDLVNVVVGVIVQKGKVFLQRRSLGDKNFPGYWECPGGGVEDGETDEEALGRELKEELGVRVTYQTADPIWRGRISGYGGRHFDFRFYGVDIVGEPKALDRQPEISWLRQRQVRGMALTPANLLAWPTIEKQFAKKKVS